MARKFTFDTAIKLSSALTTVSSDLINKNEDMQAKYINLNESFKDPVYLEFQSEFASCDRSILKACELLGELGVAVVRYAEKLRETV